MLTATRNEKQKARNRFAVIYAVSLLLVFILMSAFWRRFGPPAGPATASDAGESESFFVPLDTALHQRLEVLDALYSGYIRARKNGVDRGGAALLQAKNAMMKTLDSLDQQAGYLKEGPKKTVLNLVSSKFRKAVDDRESLMIDLMLLPKQSAPARSVAATAQPDNASEVEELKRQLDEKNARILTLENAAAAGGPEPTPPAEKDKQIASLQQQLRQKEAALQSARLAAQNKPAAGGGEWQQKYNALKSSYDKVSANEKSLKEAYKNLADDNRRLLVQLQSVRKG